MSKFDIVVRNGRLEKIVAKFVTLISLAVHRHSLCDCGADESLALSDHFEIYHFESHGIFLAGKFEIMKMSQF